MVKIGKGIWGKAGKVWGGGIGGKGRRRSDMIGTCRKGWGKVSRYGKCWNGNLG